MGKTIEQQGEKEREKTNWRGRVPNKRRCHDVYLSNG